MVFVAFRSAAAEAAYPVERAKRTFVDKVWSRLKGMHRAAETAAENVRLKREVASLAMAMDDCSRLEEENARLRAALGYATSSRSRWMVAGVISLGGGAGSARSTLRLDKGTLAGVKKGMIACVPEGLLGRVVKATPHTAEVLLLCDRSIMVSCAVEDANGRVCNGILSGGTADALVMRHFTARSEIPVGSKVFTSGLGGVFPGRLAVGTVVRVDKDANGHTKAALVRPAVDFRSVEDAFVAPGEDVAVEE